MRILHLASEYPPQEVFGLGRYVCELSRELVRQHHPTRVLTNSMGSSLQDVDDHGVAVHRVDYPPPPIPPGNVAPPLAFNLHLLQRAYRLGRAHLGNPEVIVSHDWLTAVAAHYLSKTWQIPHVWTVHDTILAKRFGRMDDPGDRITASLERWSAEQADLILVNSTSVLTDVLGLGADPATCRLVPCGIDPDRFICRLPEVRRAAFRLSLAEPDQLLITYAGRLDVEKGIDTLINAFSQVHARYPHTRLVLAGKGALEPIIKEHIHALGLNQVVQLLGYLQGDVLRAFYAVSDMHVCPSHYEPFGLVAVEAMAAGTPVIVSKIGGLADIVADPKVGMAVPPRDVPALAQALDRLCTEPDARRRLGASGAQHVRDTYSWAHIARLAVAAYGEARFEVPLMAAMPVLEAV
jgi:glycosyltransferase involved in cell wall biosynthesis